jgi:C4-dicarboxylate-specific signal transduction histidine kinase
MATSVADRARGKEGAVREMLAYLLILASALLAWGTSGLLAAGEPPRRILLLEGQAARQPGGVKTFEAFRHRLKERSVNNIEIYFDHLDLARFPGPAHAEHTARYLREKYAQTPLDLVVPNGRGSLNFLQRYRDTIAPNVPIVYCCTTAAAVETLNLPRDAVGVITEYNWDATLALAARLQPDARNLVLISGASEVDRAWEADARKAIEPFSTRYHVRYLAGLPKGDLLAEVARLPRDTHVLFTVVFADRAGQAYVPAELVSDVAAASPAPVYTAVPSLFGSGAVGGFMDSFEAQGAAAADLALEILAGKDPTTLPRQTKPTHTHLVDARALDRWGLSQSALPADTTIAFEQPTLWEQHRVPLIGAMLAFGLQTAVLAALLLQMRKRRSAERSLEESDERIAYSAASTNTGLWHLNLAGEPGWATDHCRSMLGLAPDAPFELGAILRSVHPDDRHLVEIAMERAARLGTPIELELRITAPGRDERWFAMRARPRLGPQARISGIFADVTERKIAEAQAELQRAELAHLTRVSLLGELSGAIAHELNQPLTAILANAQTARLVLSQDKPDLDLIKEVIDDIVAEDKRAGDVIHRLRGLLRKGESRAEAVDLGALMESTLRVLHSELVARQIKVDVQLAGDLPAVTGDAVQLQQVLLNLVMNAMDAMNTTAPMHRRIAARTRSDGNGMMEVTITDQGRGITPDEQKRLFQPFFTTKTHGLGLGLSICSTIVSAHGGALNIDNNIDGGTTAMLRLPIAQAEMVGAS